MPQANRNIGRLNVGFAWVNAAVFGVAAAWSVLGGLGPMPMAGLRPVSSNPWIAWSLAVLALLVAFQLSWSPLRTRTLLKLTAVALFVTWLLMVLFVAPGPAIGFAILAGTMFRQGSETEA